MGHLMVKQRTDGRVSVGDLWDGLFTATLGHKG